MASDNEASCVSDPNFAIICSFLERFGKSCGLDVLDIGKLQSMIDNSHEVSPELMDLHIKLLRKARKSVYPDRWEKAIIKFCHSYSNQDGWELERIGYKKTRVAIKLRLLKALLDVQFDANHKFKNEINKLSASELRSEPLGRDKSGLVYWCQADEECNIRVYREDLDEENWELVAKSREEVVSLINELTDGKVGAIPVSEDSNSLEASEKPTIDTGQNGITQESPEKDDSQEDCLDEKSCIEANVKQDLNQNDGSKEDPNSDNDQEEEDDEESDAEDSDEAEIDESKESVSVIGKTVIKQPQESTAKTKSELPEESPSKEENTSKPDGQAEEISEPKRETSIHAKNGVSDGSSQEPKSIETPVITSSPLKLVNIAELTQSPARKSDLFGKMSKLPVKPIDQLAANLAQFQSEKLQKPSSSKLDKIAQNLARGQANMLSVISNGEDDLRVQEQKSHRGVNLSTPSRGRDSGANDLSPSKEIAKPVDFSGMDLSSKKGAKDQTASPADYRLQGSYQQYQEMDLRTKKNPSIPHPNLSSYDPAYDARTAVLRNHTIADLSKRPSPYDAMHNSSSGYQSSRLPNYAVLPDPSKLAALRMSSSGSKRPLDSESHHSLDSVLKRVRVNALSTRPLADPAKMQHQRHGWPRNEVGQAIEEPVMMVQGEGSGSDCETNNPIFGDVIEEPVMFFHGEGSGAECDTGNPIDDTSPAGTKEEVDDKKEGDPCTSDLKSPKQKFKLGVQVFSAVPSPNTIKKSSRWDVGGPLAKSDTPEETEAMSVSPPKFFFGPNCVSYGTTKAKEDPDTSQELLDESVNEEKLLNSENLSDTTNKKICEELASAHIEENDNFLALEDFEKNDTSCELNNSHSAQSLTATQELTSTSDFNTSETAPNEIPTANLGSDENENNLGSPDNCFSQTRTDESCENIADLENNDNVELAKQERLQRELDEPLVNPGSMCTNREVTPANSEFHKEESDSPYENERLDLVENSDQVDFMVSNEGPMKPDHDLAENLVDAFKSQNEFAKSESEPLLENPEGDDPIDSSGQLDDAKECDVSVDQSTPNEEFVRQNQKHSDDELLDRSLNQETEPIESGQAEISCPKVSEGTEESFNDSSLMFEESLVPEELSSIREQTFLSNDKSELDDDVLRSDSKVVDDQCDRTLNSADKHDEHDGDFEDSHKNKSPYSPCDGGRTVNESVNVEEDISFDSTLDKSKLEEVSSTDFDRKMEVESDSPKLNLITDENLLPASLSEQDSVMSACQDDVKFKEPITLGSVDEDIAAELEDTVKMEETFSIENTSRLYLSPKLSTTASDKLLDRSQQNMADVSMNPDSSNVKELPTLNRHMMSLIDISKNDFEPSFEQNDLDLDKKIDENASEVSSLIVECASVQDDIESLPPDSTDPVLTDDKFDAGEPGLDSPRDVSIEGNLFDDALSEAGSKDTPFDEGLVQEKNLLEETESISADVGGPPKSFREDSSTNQVSSGEHRETVTKSDTSVCKQIEDEELIKKDDVADSGAKEEVVGITQKYSGSEKSEEQAVESSIRAISAYKSLVPNYDSDSCGTGENDEVSGDKNIENSDSYPLDEMTIKKDEESACNNEIYPLVPITRQYQAVDPVIELEKSASADSVEQEQTDLSNEKDDQHHTISEMNELATAAVSARSENIDETGLSLKSLKLQKLEISDMGNARDEQLNSDADVSFGSDLVNDLKSAPSLSNHGNDKLVNNYEFIKSHDTDLIVQQSSTDELLQRDPLSKVPVLEERLDQNNDQEKSRYSHRRDSLDRDISDDNAITQKSKKRREEIDEFSAQQETSEISSKTDALSPQELVSAEPKVSEEDSKVLPSEEESLVESVPSQCLELSVRDDAAEFEREDSCQETLDDSKVGEKPSTELENVDSENIGVVENLPSKILIPEKEIPDNSLVDTAKPNENMSTGEEESDKKNSRHVSEDSTVEVSMDEAKTDVQDDVGIENKSAEHSKDTSELMDSETPKDESQVALVASKDPILEQTSEETQGPTDLPTSDMVAPEEPMATTVSIDEPEPSLTEETSAEAPVQSGPMDTGDASSVEVIATTQSGMQVDETPKLTEEVMQTSETPQPEVVAQVEPMQDLEPQQLEVESTEQPMQELEPQQLKVKSTEQPMQVASSQEDSSNASVASKAADETVPREAILEHQVDEAQSDDSMGCDNGESMFDAPPAEEVDPLADPEPEKVSKQQQSKPSGIRVKAVSELLGAGSLGWKMDSPASSPAAHRQEHRTPAPVPISTRTTRQSRKRRNSAHDSHSEDVAAASATNFEDEDATAGKRIKLRGKRQPDVELRKSIEKNRKISASSEDDVPRRTITTITLDDNSQGEEPSSEATDVVQQQQQLEQEGQTEGDDTPAKKGRGRPRGRKRKVGRPGRPKKILDQSKDEATDDVADESTECTDLATNEKAETEQSSSSPVKEPAPKKKPRKKRNTMLGLEIPPDIENINNETPVRASRRIAQIRIQKEADKSRIEDEIQLEGKGKKHKKDKVGKQNKMQAQVPSAPTPEKKRRKKQKQESEDDAQMMKFDESNPWVSSSGSSTENEHEEEEEEDLSDGEHLVFKSDHEFSCDSDIEKDEQASAPIRRARTAQKSKSDEEGDDDAVDEYACQKCTKSDHPEWILLCDNCDKGWHCSCLRPALMLIPEGDWYCPPCQHASLVVKLQESLKTLDILTKKHENELLKKKRLAFVGISLENVLPKEEQGRSRKISRGSSQGDDDDSSAESNSESSSGSSSSEESEPVYQLRERRCANTYKFNEYDEMINAAIGVEVESVKGAGNQGRGKDISTIVNAEKEEKAHDDDAYSDEDFKGSSSEEEDPDEQISSSADSEFGGRRRGRRDSKPIRRSTRNRQTRYDEDFINDNSDDSDRPKKKKSRGSWRDDSESEESDNSWRQTKKSRRTTSTSKRFATKAKPSKKKKKRKRIITNDSDDDDEEPQSKYDKAPQEASQDPGSEDANVEDGTDTRNQEISASNTDVEVKQDTGDLEESIPANRVNKHQESSETTDVAPSEYVAAPVVEEIGKKKKEPKQKKIRRKVIYGRIRDEDEIAKEEMTLGRRTRGRKISYLDAMPSDSDEELKKALKKTEETEEEFVVNETEDLDDQVEKDSDSGDMYKPNQLTPRAKNKSPKPLRGKKSPGVKRKSVADDGTPKQRKKPGPKPGGMKKQNLDNSSEDLSTTIDSSILNESDVLSEMQVDDPVQDVINSNVTGEGSLEGLGPSELEGLDEEQFEQMMMEDEEYARQKALEILAAERQENMEGTDMDVPKKKKRGRRSKAEILAEEMRREAMGLPPEPFPPSLGVVPPQPQTELPVQVQPPPQPQLQSNEMVTSPAPVPTMPMMEPCDQPRMLEAPMIPMMSPQMSEYEMMEGQPPQAMFNPDGTPMKPKRRGRGKGKKTLAMEAAKAAEAAAKAAAESGILPPGDVNPDELQQPPGSVLPTPGSSTSGSAPSTPPAIATSQGPPSSQASNPQTMYPSMPPQSQQPPHSSVITRMLQSQPVPNSPQTFTQAAAAMGQKYFGGPNMPGQMMSSPRPGFDMQNRGRIPSPYRQQGQPMPPHFGGARPNAPPPGMRLRVPGPQLYHTPHHPMDPSPSGGGPISIGPRGAPGPGAGAAGPGDRSSPLGPMIPPSAGSPLGASGVAGSKPSPGAPTPPPPPPYVQRRFESQMSPRHPMSPFGAQQQQQQQGPSPSVVMNHSMGSQQPGGVGRPPGNFSPYHPPPGPNYMYGAYPPPPPMSTADDAAPYSRSPYSTVPDQQQQQRQHHYPPPHDPGQPPPQQQPPPRQQGPQTQQHPGQAHPHPHALPQQLPHPNPGGKYDEEGSGEFGGLVSYFSSQREDDLES
ncbi:hypothetical protein QAD02_010629 [Eretmocerus hayati]|uniref:Uncharacterized protein n=1 Tax=Eretmocerus hayati TaxID=131215 RepID=A0ACC2NUG7_9HYME|nr:hypothetical protein QAD02_010629 [Eretmocerus hayati]